MKEKVISSEEMQQIDRKAIFDFGIPSIVLMENAGKAVYEEAQNILQTAKSKPSKKVLCLCGKGNNGGDGLVVSRYLINDGIDVLVYLLCEEKHLKQDPLINFKILKKMGVSVACIKGDLTNDLSEFDLIIDAIFGTGFRGSPDKLTSALIESINKSGVPVLSIDVPSGLNATTGLCEGSCIHAKRTVSFGLPKSGFYTADGLKVTGKLVIKNIGFPTLLLK